MYVCFVIMMNLVLVCSDLFVPHTYVLASGVVIDIIHVSV